MSTLVATHLVAGIGLYAVAASLVTRLRYATAQLSVAIDSDSAWTAGFQLLRGRVRAAHPGDLWASGCPQAALVALAGVPCTAFHNEHSCRRCSTRPACDGMSPIDYEHYMAQARGATAA